MNKPTWIFVAGTYRTASTTQYRIAQDVVVETKNGIGVGYHQEQKFRRYDIPSRHRYAVCKVFEFLPDGFQGRPSLGGVIYRERRLKACVTIRDPRDIITSMRERHRRQMEDPKHQRKPFDFEYRVTVEFPVWLRQLAKWIDLGPSVTLVSRYEVFTKNLVGEAKLIADHLNIPISQDLAKLIAGRHSLKAIVNHKKASRKAHQREDPHLPNIPGPLFGKPGAHEEHLTKRECELVERACRGFMRRFGYL